MVVRVNVVTNKGLFSKNFYGDRVKRFTTFTLKTIVVFSSGGGDTSLTGLPKINRAWFPAQGLKVK